MALSVAVFSVMVVFRTMDRIRLCAVLGLAIAAASPIVTSIDWRLAPPILKQYLAPDTLFFGFFPWAAFFAFGMSYGSIIRSVADENMDRVMQWTALAGGGLIVGARYFADLPYSLYAKSEFWLDSPALILIKLGVMFWILTFAFLWTRYLASPGWSWIRQLGTTSLLVYWVHVELVYGRWLWPWKENLDVPRTVFASAAIILLMLVLSVMSTKRWSARRASFDWYPFIASRLPQRADWNRPPLDHPAPFALPDLDRIPRRLRHYGYARGATNGHPQTALATHQFHLRLRPLASAVWPQHRKRQVIVRSHRGRRLHMPLRRYHRAADRVEVAFVRLRRVAGPLPHLQRRVAHVVDHHAGLLAFEHQALLRFVNLELLLAVQHPLVVGRRRRRQFVGDDDDVRLDEHDVPQRAPQAALVGRRRIAHHVIESVLELRRADAAAQVGRVRLLPFAIHQHRVLRAVVQTHLVKRAAVEIAIDVVHQQRLAVGVQRERIVRIVPVAPAAHRARLEAHLHVRRRAFGKVVFSIATPVPRKDLRRRQIRRASVGSHRGIALHRNRAPARPRLPEPPRLSSTMPSADFASAARSNS